jgi:hypothetical protein
MRVIADEQTRLAPYRSHAERAFYERLEAERRRVAPIIAINRMLAEHDRVLSHVPSHTSPSPDPDTEE